MLCAHISLVVQVAGLFVLIFFWLAGSALVEFLHWPIPGSVMGIIGLWIALVLNGGVPEWLKKPGTMLISNMTLLFVPAGVGLINHWDRMTEHGIAIVVIITASTLLTAVLMILVFKLLRVKL
jgi:holin-like protein